jgi:hypothetical protein
MYERTLNQMRTSLSILLFASLLCVVGTSVWADPKAPAPKSPPAQAPAPTGQEPKTSDEPDEVITKTPPHRSMSKRSGIPLPFLYLAGNACTLQLSCTPGLRDQLRERAQDWLAQCKVNLAQSWCSKQGSCKEDGLDPDGPDWIECYKNVYSRDCKRLNEPIQCKLIRGRSMTLTPTSSKK